MTIAAGTLPDRYEIISPLGVGGMGEVYLAQDKQLNRHVAIKFPTVTSDAHQVHARFLREARAVSTLSHPHIATIYDYGETRDGQPFIIMEFISGQSLSHLMQTSALTIARAVEIISDVADALAEAHRHGIIHRDIKPSNVMINERGDVKVLDFGLAKQVGEQSVGTVDSEAKTVLETHTRSGVVVGTLLYLSPEQAIGDTVDRRSDIFALGLLLYECVTGKSAFSGKNAIEIIANVIHAQPVEPSTINPHISPELDRIILKAIAKVPDARYQSADDLRADLLAVHQRLENSSKVRTQHIVHALSTRRSSALITLSDMLRRPRLSPLVVLLVFAFGGLGVWGFIQWRRPRLHVPTAESQRLFDTGTNALRTGSFFQASKVLALAVQSDDRFALAHARLAEAWTELDYAGKAKDELLRVGELTPDRSLFPLVDALYLDAVTATVRRDFAKAVEAYAEIARQQPDQPQVYVDLGRAYEKNNQLDKAIESYGMAIGHDQQNATAFLRLGILYGRKHDLPAATTTFDKAAELYQALSNIEGSTEVAFQRGVLLNDIQGQIAEARAQLERARDMANVNKSHYQLIKILFQLSNVSLKEGKTDQAQQEAREAVESAQANQMESLSARGSIDLGYVYLVRADYQNAERYFKQALDLAQGFGGLQNQARAQLSLASLYMQRGEADLALSYEEPALTFYQNGGYRTETSQALLLRGRAFKQKGDYNSALQSFQQQLQIAEQTGDQSQIAYSHGSMGNLLYEQERYAEAREHFGESYERYKSAGNQLYQGYALMNLSAALWGLGHFDDARNMLNQASDIASRKSSDLKGLQTSINLLEADMSLSERHFPEVLSKSRQAMDLAGTQNLSVTVEGKYLIGLAQALSGQTRAGQTTCQEATDAAAPLGDPLLLSRSQLALAEASLAAGDTQRAIASAKQAQAFFAGAGLSASEWRSWLIAGLASQKSGDRDKAQLCLTKAAETLASLQQKWGTEVFNNYVSRPDVQVYRKQLGDYVSMAKP